MKNTMIVRPRRRKPVRWTDRPFTVATTPDVSPAIVQQLARPVPNVLEDAAYQAAVNALESAVLAATACYYERDTTDADTQQAAVRDLHRAHHALARCVNGLLAAV